MVEQGPPRRFATLAEHLEVLASEPRLELLHVLRTPQELNEIRVRAASSREGETADRPISRQAVTAHLDLLREAGLVQRLERGPMGPRGDRFVLNHERLFALVDEMRNLSKLRPIFVDPEAPAQTLQRSSPEGPRLPPPPRLVVAYGRDDGVAFPLHPPAPAGFRIGRSAQCEIRLDYDPFLSSQHAVLERRDAGFTLTDLGSRNGTLVNWEPVPPSVARPLTSGDLVTVGRTVLVLQQETHGASGE